MTSYLLRRTGSTIVTLFVVTTLVFLLTRWLPFDPVAAKLGVGRSGVPVPESVREAILEQTRLDLSIREQYTSWLGEVIRGDLGESWVTGEPVLGRIARSFPLTAELALCGLLLAAAVAFPIGVLGARAPGGPLDRVGSAGSLLLYSLPSFWIAILLIDLLVLRLRLFPLFGSGSLDEAALGVGARFLDHLHHLLLPALVIALANVALLLRFTRAAMIAQLGEEYVTAARARGVTESRLLMRHVLRNAAIPLVTLTSLVVPGLLSGSAIVERIFQWDGIGNLLFSSVLARDYPMIMGLTILGAVITLAASLLADLVYSWIDPRVRIGEGRG